MSSRMWIPSVFPEFVVRVAAVRRRLTAIVAGGHQAVVRDGDGTGEAWPNSDLLGKTGGGFGGLTAARPPRNWRPAGPER